MRPARLPVVTHPLTLSRRGLLVGSAATVALAAAPADAGKEPGKAKAKRYRIDTRNSDIDTGAAVILVHAPLEQVLDVVLDFRKYHRILPRLEQSRIVRRNKGKTDVYLRAPVLNGAYNLWGIARFEPPKRYKSEGKLVKGRMVKGNINHWFGSWKLEPKDDQRTVLRMEMFVDPDVPVPDSWVTPELMWAADKGVTAVRDMAEDGRATARKD